MELRDGRCRYASEITPETRALWERVEANRQAFMREVPQAARDRLWSAVNMPTDAEMIGLSGDAKAHARFCWAVSAKPTTQATKKGTCYAERRLDRLEQPTLRRRGFR